MTCHDIGERIDAYIDNELAPGEAALVAQHIESCAPCRRMLEDREALRRLLRGLPYHRAPVRLQEAIAASPARTRTRRVAWTIGLAAAASIVLAAGLTVSIFVRHARETSGLADLVVAQHVHALSSAALIEVASSDQHNVKPWFQGKLDFSPPVPDLSAAGFVLSGGRTDTIGGRPAAALVYRRRLHVINVFMWPDEGRAAATDRRTIRGFHERHWTQNGMSMWAVSDVNEADLDAFAQAFRQAGV